MFLKAKKKRDILHWPSQSSELNSVKHAFQLLKTGRETQKPAATEGGCHKGLVEYLKGGSAYPWVLHFRQ